ncbi:MAG: 3-isopropylmalate dehydrogenase [Ignavibacteria bacterium]|nr:3-isopropylmalate dehydrogenase [Ignavibacteria bacterium]
MKSTIVVLPGDGIGPEVTEEAVRVLQDVGSKFGHEFTFTDYLIGGRSIDRFGTALTAETLAACKASDAVLLGAVGGPKWDDPHAKVRPEQGLLALRKELGLYANLRPVKPFPVLVNVSPLKPEKLKFVDLIVVRELTGGLYFGKPRGRDRVNGFVRAVDTMEYYDYEIKRVVEFAFKLAKSRRKKVTSVDKANVLETSRLWRQTAVAVASGHVDVLLEHMLVDTASVRLITSPSSFDVVVTENMFGDILTDEVSVLTGSMGMLPSASLGDNGPGVYEPVHGSAPDIAGKGIANPIGAILSAAMLLRYSLHLERESVAIETAVDQAVTNTLRPMDLGGRLNTRQMTDRIIAHIVSNQ